MDGAESVPFWINQEKYSVHFVAPFYLNGKDEQSVKPWETYSEGENFIECIGSNGNYFAATFTIDCASVAAGGINKEDEEEGVAARSEDEFVDKDDDGDSVEPKNEEPMGTDAPACEVNEVANPLYCVTKKATEYLGEKIQPLG